MRSNNIMEIDLEQFKNIQFIKQSKPTPDPDCRWCKGSGEVALATTTKPCLDCLVPYEGWIWDDMDKRCVDTVYYFDVDGHEVECVGVREAAKHGHEPLPQSAVSVGRLWKWSRAGRKGRR